MATFYKAPTVNFFSTTLNGAITDTQTTITLNSTTNLNYPGVVILDREDGNGTATPNSREVVAFTGISGNDITGCTRGFDGSTARSHSSGALVESAPFVGMWNDMRNAVATALTTDGTGLAISGTASISSIVASNLTLSNVNASTLIETKRLAVTSIASIARLDIATHLNVSGASVTGITSGAFNALFQVPGSLTSQANVGGLIPVPSAVNGQYLQAYVQTPASIASVAAFVLKNGAVYGTVQILAGNTYASSASISSTALVAGDVLTLDIRSTASLAADLSVLLRAS